MKVLVKGRLGAPAGVRVWRARRRTRFGVASLRLERPTSMRATTAFNTLLDLPGANVTSVELKADEVKLGVRLRRKRLVCPEPDCEYSTRWRADTRPEDSRPPGVAP